MNLIILIIFECFLQYEIGNVNYLLGNLYLSLLNVNSLNLGVIIDLFMDIELVCFSLSIDFFFDINVVLVSLFGIQMLLVLVNGVNLNAGYVNMCFIFDVIVFINVGILLYIGDW